jgi:hypothetical protein
MMAGYFKFAYHGLPARKEADISWHKTKDFSLIACEVSFYRFKTRRREKIE